MIKTKSKEWHKKQGDIGQEPIKQTSNNEHYTNYVLHDNPTNLQQLRHHPLFYDFTKSLLSSIILSILKNFAKFLKDSSTKYIL